MSGEMRKSPIGLMQRIAAGRGVLSARAQQIVSITREESILAKMFGLQYMLGASMPPSGVYITGTYVVGIYALLYWAVSTICEDEIENKRARE